MTGGQRNKKDMNIFNLVRCRREKLGHSSQTRISHALTSRLSVAGPDHGQTRKGSRWLRQVPVEVTHAAAKTLQTSLVARYQHIAARRGKKRALVALRHTILVIIYTLLTRQQPYQDLGTADFDSLAQ
jgi:hypothetical protein